jgi:hypothetical protein
MATGNFYTLAKPLQSDQRLKEERDAATRRLSVTGDKAEAEPEARLWKVCAEAAAPQFTVLELAAFRCSESYRWERWSLAFPSCSSYSPVVSSTSLFTPSFNRNGLSGMTLLDIFSIGIPTYVSEAAIVLYSLRRPETFG